MIKDITVTITEAEIPGQIGVYTPLIIQGNATKAIPYTECKILKDVVAAGFEEETGVYKQCAAIVAQNNRPRVFAVCAVTTNIVAELPNIAKEHSFRQVIAVPGESGDTLEELTSYFDAAENKMLFIAVDAAEKLPQTKPDHALAIVYAGKSEGIEGAIVGATAGLATGSFTYKNIVLNGIVPDDLSASEVKAIHDKGAICILRKAGDVVTSEGYVMSGEYADAIDGIDYIVSNIEHDVQKCLNKNPKVPYTDVGIAQLEAVTYNVLASAYQMGIIDTDDSNSPAFATHFKTRAECSAGDKAARVYNGGNFEFSVMGAIHYAHIEGTVVI